MSEFWRNGKNDEYYTPKILVEPILPYIKPHSTIWCPFDMDDSEYVLTFKEHGHNVINGHIWQGKDFFDYTPECDYVISNPPFSRKLDVFKKLFEIDKPFAMLLGLPILNYQEIGEFFIGKEIQLLIVDKKVSFDGNNPSFNSSYFCYKMLPRDLMFVHLEHSNRGKRYIPSRMHQSAQVQEQLMLEIEE